MIKPMEIKESNNFNKAQGDCRGKLHLILSLSPCTAFSLKHQSHNYAITSIDLDEWTCLLRDLQRFIWVIIKILMRVISVSNKNQGN